jgi:CYTH domain-containing protein
VRVRLLGEKGLLTVKGIGNQSGTTRFEWEREISLSDAEQLLKLCEPGAIDKERYYVKVISHIFEIDVFHLDNEGLIVAEIELEAEHESFFKPSWLGEEVTGQPKYYNASLSKFPYKHWK